jgi:hypothetical protein
MHHKYVDKSPWHTFVELAVARVSQPSARTSRTREETRPQNFCSALRASRCIDKGSTNNVFQVASWLMTCIMAANYVNKESKAERSSRL